MSLQLQEFPYVISIKRVQYLLTTILLILYRLLRPCLCCIILGTQLCDPSPCLNNGTCQYVGAAGTEFFCTCSDNYVGDKCQFQSKSSLNTTIVLHMCITYSIVLISLQQCYCNNARRVLFRFIVQLITYESSQPLILKVIDTDNKFPIIMESTNDHKANHHKFMTQFLKPDEHYPRT